MEFVIKVGEESRLIQTVRGAHINTFVLTRALLMANHRSLDVEFSNDKCSPVENIDTLDVLGRKFNAICYKNILFSHGNPRAYFDTQPVLIDHHISKGRCRMASLVYHVEKIKASGFLQWLSEDGRYKLLKVETPERRDTAQEGWGHGEVQLPKAQTPHYLGTEKAGELFVKFIEEEKKILLSTELAETMGYFKNLRIEAEQGTFWGIATYNEWQDETMGPLVFEDDDIAQTFLDVGTTSLLTNNPKLLEELSEMEKIFMHEWMEMDGGTF